MGIGISGMGRIGRLLIRSMFMHGRLTRQLKAINCMYPPETIAHLLKYDTVHGTWDAEFEVSEGRLRINDTWIDVVGEREPENIPWANAGVELAIDATGKFNRREGAGGHLAAGARKVIITAPGQRMDRTIVMGVNDRSYDPSQHSLLSAASCTTNCVAPILKVIDDAFGVQSGWVTTVHALTSDQKHVDNPHKDLRRARACTQSIIPTSTGLSSALADVLPGLASRIHGVSVRVPTQDVSLADFTLQLKRDAGAEDVKAAFRAAARGDYAHYIGYTEEPLVSADFVGNSKSAVVDGLSVEAVDGHVKILAWYDNEWAYACRVVELAEWVLVKEEAGGARKHLIPS
ncbi:type I glyceraldehyde-3-phosphate dehydrogenase [Paenibacillus sp.]|uniref:type I glyceraldehyde-3-phosphate dehydrogenase n=1 Tax=Paenibacillus sp. TaxID=58172 RepID=UPI002D4728C6|nr:type I glyceraldehyde-3-phosphate dehydrogenase [Paenibacillus sp.]HZG87947.1 type I glyceraldehyde-3-phosphate dehydrogenase [Paenibacillus sp.]